MRSLKLTLALVLMSGSLPGCVAFFATLPPQKDRLRTLHTVVLAPPRVVMYQAPLRLVPEWTEAARGQLQRALAERFVSDDHVVVSPPDPERAEALARAVDGLPLWSIDKYGTIQTIVARRPALSCASDSGPVLAAAGEADAVLLTYAVETVKTPALAAFTAIAGAINPENWALLPLWLAVDPKGWAGFFWGRGHAAIQLCLVDRRTAEVLWFRLDESHSGRLFRDPEALDAVISDAHIKLQKLTGALDRPKA